MEFARPLFLILLLGALALPRLSRHSLVGMRTAAARRCLILRGLLVSLLALAAAGPRWSFKSDRIQTVVLVDTSESVEMEGRTSGLAYAAEADAAKSSGDLIGVLGFAGDVSVIQPLGEAAFKPATPTPAKESGTGVPKSVSESTDVGGALDFAATLLPGTGNRRVLVVSDGRDTEGRGLREAERLRERGITVDVVPLPIAEKPEVLVRRIEIPEGMRQGEPFEATVVVHATAAGRGTVSLFRDDLLAGAPQEIALNPGENRVVFGKQKAGRNFVRFEAKLESASDTRPENNSLRELAAFRGEPRILVVDGSEEQARPFVETLKGMGLGVELRGVPGLPSQAEDLEAFDLLVLSDVPASALGNGRMGLYQRWVNELGGALLMVGGENSFGAGGYYRTPLEEALPVRMQREDRQEHPSVALLVVLDRSGSMAAGVPGGQTKMALANQGALYALEVLQSRDWFGLLAVDTKAYSLVPLDRVTSAQGWDRRILSLTAGGGGIYVYTALAEAFRSLRDNPARIKHVILFSDSADAEEKVAGEMGGTKGGGSALDLASTMLAGGVTTSVVALGGESDRDVLFLRALAERGNGRFYLTGDATTLPQIFTAETMKVAQSSLVEEPFRALPVTPGEPLDGIDWPSSPLLLGYNATRPKPGAIVHLATEGGDPLLTTWRFGAGRVGAFSSDFKSRWGAEWMTWPGYGKFWAQAVRYLISRDEPRPVRIRTVLEAGKVVVKTEATDARGVVRPGLKVNVFASSPGQETPPTQRVADEVGPGRYEAKFDPPDSGELLIQVAIEGDGKAHPNSYNPGYPAEYLTSGTDLEFLTKLAEAGGGRVLAKPAETFRRPDHPQKERLELSAWLLGMAIILFPLDIYLRRRA